MTLTIHHNTMGNSRVAFVMLVMLLNAKYAPRIQAARGERIQGTRVFHDKNFVKSQCRFKKDSIYGGVFADCSGQGLEAPPAAVLPSDTTTLWLQNNNIHSLTNDSFVGLPELKCLVISHNYLNSIDILAFKQNTKLVSLYLESNYIHLDNGSGKFPVGALENLDELVDLRLALNDNDRIDCSGSYSTDLLKGLVNLQILTIDTFYCDLQFNNIFKNTPSLSSLTITGGVTKILNDTFDGFDTIALKELTIRNSGYLIFTAPDAFRFFRHLDSLSLEGVSQGVKNTLDSLRPLRNLSLDSLYLDSVNDVNDVRGRTCIILTKDMTQYVSEMCVKHLTLKNNGILYVEQGALSTGKWARCILSLDISDNPMIGNNLELVGIKRFRALQSFKFTDRKFSFLDRRDNNGDSSDYLQCLPKTCSTHYPGMRTTMLGRGDELFLPNSILNEPISKKTINDKKLITKPTTTHAVIKRAQLNKNLTEPIRKQNRFRSFTSDTDAITFKIQLPRNMTYFNINHLSNNEGTLDYEYDIKGGENLMEVHVSDCGLKLFTGIIRGIENVHTVDISRNDGSTFLPRFFNSIPNVRKLNMSQMSLSSEWIIKEGRNSFSKITKLVSLDLTRNSLHSISSDTFSSNDKLAALGLSGNRLNTFPIDLSQHPDMCLLDLRSNSISRLKHDTIDMIEAHGRRVKTFSLWLEGNIFSCTCSNMRFLSWLQRTHIHLDNERDYSCILENGTLTSTQRIYLDGFWRECNGKLTFLISLIVVSFMILGYCLLLVWMKFETHLKAAFIKFIGKTLPSKKRNEYAYDVYIGYSDYDVNLACEHLKNTIEKYVGYPHIYPRHRDLIPASDMADSIVSAIESSWRVVLLMTEDYIQDHWSYFAIKWAMHSVQAANPDRLVLVFTSHQLLQHQIMTSVLKVVPESNIVYLHESAGKDGLSPQEEKLLFEALCH